MPLLVSGIDLSGKWEKDKENSDLDAYGQMLSLIGLTGLKKTGALKLINGLVIEQSAQPPQLTVRYEVSRVKFLDNVENFAFDQQTQMPRRDGRPGCQTGTLNESNDGIQTVITWGNPNPGMCSQMLNQDSNASHNIKCACTKILRLVCAVTLTETYSVQHELLTTMALVEAQDQQLSCKQVHAPFDFYTSATTAGRHVIWFMQM